ncbi:phosphoethanolamine transferase [Moritella sp.]|uniref:phosphoethanolamine transferase n=1 Tax=Moritella sp. TaxID=78556 RepID=UPI001E13F21A|nr:phosphoethanolamine transferase [Moritella sp.]MCJ8348821.1 phosphoethanolamine transferase [Moritella sp.]NQZ38696.1 phosphoethanolamine transferase [Moritella sp.]
MLKKAPVDSPKNIIYLTIYISLIYIYYIFIIVDSKYLGIDLNYENVKYIIGVALKASISTVFILIISSIFKSKYINLLLFIIISAISSIILFVSIQYGRFELGSYTSIMETNPKESIEMFYTFDIPLVVFLQFIITPVILFRINQYSFGLKINSMLIATLILLIALSSSQAKNNLILTVSATGEVVRTPMSRAYYILFNMPLLKPIPLAQSYSQLKKIENSPITVEWTNIAVANSSNRKNYVVIIGESVQKSSLFSYGYHRKTTKSLKETNGMTLISDPVAPAPQTGMALSRVLAINNKLNINNNLNIIDLANISGFNTFWFSNQGQIGVYDSPITNIAKRTNLTIFHNQNYQQANSDLVLIEDLATHLDGNSNNIYFLHMIGSHFDFCERTKNAIKLEDAYRAQLNNDQNCYDDSILNTSIFINKVVSRLKSTSLDYEVIYFSDHGLVDIERKPYKSHGVGNLFQRKALEVPLIFISSSKTNSDVQNTTYYMRDFPHTFAEWLGVTATQIDYTKSVFHPGIKQEKYAVNDSSEIIYFTK